MTTSPVMPKLHALTASASAPATQEVAFGASKLRKAFASAAALATFAVPVAVATDVFTASPVAAQEIPPPTPTDPPPPTREEAREQIQGIREQRAADLAASRAEQRAAVQAAPKGKDGKDERQAAREAGREERQGIKEDAQADIRATRCAAGINPGKNC